MLTSPCGIGGTPSPPTLLHRPVWVGLFSHQLAASPNLTQPSKMAASLVNPTGNAFSNKFAAELIATARAIVAPGKGILAADESTGTIGKRVRGLQGRQGLEGGTH